MSWRKWRHVTKLDPDKVLSDGAIEEIAASGTDALMLSGTLDVTPEKLDALFCEVKDAGLPLVVEPADPAGARFSGSDFVFVPTVLNAKSHHFISGLHATWAANYPIQWDKVVPEGYIVLNPESSVAKLTKSDCTLESNMVAGYACVAEKFFSLPIVYIEYSGTFGNPDVLKAAAAELESSRLFYGGGIDSKEKAAIMGEFADTIVVGNAVYTKGASVLRETVNEVK